MDKLDLVIDSLRSIDSKLDRALERVSESEVEIAKVTTELAALKQSFNDHRSDDQKLAVKVESLNKWKWTVAGGLTVMTFIANYLAKLF